MQSGCELPQLNNSDAIKIESHEEAAKFRGDVGAISHDSRAEFTSMVSPMPRKPLGFKCDKCGRVFTKKSNMKKHREIHTDELPNFECWLCHKM